MATTPNFSFITPNLCDDGHDYPCTNTTGAGQGGGSSVGDINKWLQTWVPIITASPAFKQDGLLEITFDEADAPPTLTPAVVRQPGPAADAGGNGSTAPAAVKWARCSSRRSSLRERWFQDASYNHYSSLASIEDLFGLPHLGEAQTVTTNFDKHIYTK